MLGCYTSSEAVWTTEGNVARLNTARHVVCFSSGVYDLVNGLHSKVEGHKFALEMVNDHSLHLHGRGTYHRVKTSQCRPYSQAGKSRLCNGTINDSFLAKTI